jgi:hypothetical protein
LSRSERFSGRPRFQAIGVASGNIEHVQVTRVVDEPCEPCRARVERLDQCADVVANDHARASTVMHCLHGFLGRLLAVEARRGVVAGIASDARVGEILLGRLQPPLPLEFRFGHTR